jgi:hypothetical protein
MQEPEVNSVELNADNNSVTYDVRIVRNSECCGDEMKEANFSDEATIPEDIVAKMDAIREKDDDAEFDVEEGGVETLEECGGRYAKSYYGFTLTVSITHDGKSLGEFDISDKIAASYMDEMV